MEREKIIRRLIKKQGLSVRAFAEKADIPYTTLHSMLSRGIGNASVDNVLKVCKALGITFEELENMAQEGIQTIAAHHENEDFTEEELEEIERFKEFIKVRRNQK